MLLLIHIGIGLLHHLYLLHLLHLLHLLDLLHLTTNVQTLELLSGCLKGFKLLLKPVLLFGKVGIGIQKLSMQVRVNLVVRDLVELDLGRRENLFSCVVLLCESGSGGSRLIVLLLLLILLELVLLLLLLLLLLELKLNLLVLLLLLHLTSSESRHRRLRSIEHVRAIVEVRSHGIAVASLGGERRRRRGDIGEARSS